MDGSHVWCGFTTILGNFNGNDEGLLIEIFKPKSTQCFREFRFCVRNYNFLREIVAA